MIINYRCFLVSQEGKGKCKCQRNRVWRVRSKKRLCCLCKGLFLEVIPWGICLTLSNWNTLFTIAIACTRSVKELLKIVKEKYLRLCEYCLVDNNSN